MCISAEEHDSMRALVEEAEETVALSAKLYAAVQQAKGKNGVLVPLRLPVFDEKDLAEAKTG